MTIPRRTITLAVLASGLLSGPAWPKDPPLHAVEKAVTDRTGFAVRWQQNAQAREEALTQVRALLKKPLNVDRAVQVALLNNRDLLATLEDVGVSAADLREAGLWKNPSINLSLRFPDRPPSATDAEEGVAFDLLDLLMIPLRKRVAADHLVAAQLRVADEALRLVAEVKAEIYWLQGDAAMLAHRKTIVDVNATAVDLAQRQHEAGNITDLALNQQQATYNAARLALAAAENEQREHREKLNRLLSLWGPDTAWKLTEGLPALPEGNVPLRGLESLAVAQRLDLAAARAELESVVRALGLTKSYRYIGALEFGVDTEHNPDHSNVTGPTLRLELPLFNQGQARVAKSEAELRQAERKLEGLAIDIRSNVRALHDKLAALRETVQFYQKEIVPTQQAVATGTLLRYNGMLLGNYDVFATRAEAADAEQKSIEALRDYWITRTELERVVGGNLHPQRPAKTADYKTN
ncbi:outer membrane efflux protein [Chthoniobacter flavus Ellin428]|uniref:Outer membrane efflux protein n=1 Tax=Chthoniobacter flavus Ellin428 TaxID=497964 RepID=B4CZ73_9BACT|nr:TolC family protein [Chthoniobacter flavus]EDY20764.1 outer membrane efflux protein [Chthoniobacter flavus Ellin428]TCO89658.1 cobalt-zinc-cadmium efflux system outer membrane protein [Chthoniobacter flavus]